MTETLRRHAPRALWGLALVLLAGTVIDLGILWFAQRQATAQWEYVAIVNTLEGMSGLLMAAALAYLGLAVSDSDSIMAYRVAASMLLLTGLAGGVFGALLLTDYFALARNVSQEAIGTFRSTTFKALALSGLYVVVFLPVGFLGMRGGRTRRRGRP